jgi:hypothetical protein
MSENKNTNSGTGIEEKKEDSSQLTNNINTTGNTTDSTGTGKGKRKPLKISNTSTAFVPSTDSTNLKNETKEFQTHGTCK